MNKHLQIINKNRLNKKRRSGSLVRIPSKYADTAYAVGLGLAVPLVTFMHVNHQEKLGDYSSPISSLIADANGNRSMIREAALAVTLFGTTYFITDTVLDKINV